MKVGVALAGGRSVPLTTQGGRQSLQTSLIRTFGLEPPLPRCESVPHAGRLRVLGEQTCKVRMRYALGESTRFPSFL
jgi:hypothetical protein